MRRKIKRKNHNKGFTLVELVIVVAILAILVGLLAPQYTKYVEKSRKAADVNNLEEIVKALQIAYTENNYNFPLKPDEYIWITIRYFDKGNAKISDIDWVGADGTDLKASVEADVTEILGNQWMNTKLKSSRWEGNQILAMIEVKNETLHVAEYYPESLKDYL